MANLAKEAQKVEADETKSTNTGSVVFENVKTGAYLVLAQGEKVTYSVMGAVTYEANPYIVAKDSTVVAKPDSSRIEKEADDALKNNTTYDTWQEGFESLFNMLKEDRDFVLNVYHHIPGDYIDRYLYKVTYDLLYQVVEEKSKDMMVKEEDKCFIANFYKYGFVGLVVEWLNRDMVDDPKMIVSRLNSLIKGSFAQALSNARINH